MDSVNSASYTHFFSQRLQLAGTMKPLRITDVLVNNNSMTKNYNQSPLHFHEMIFLQQVLSLVFIPPSPRESSCQYSHTVHAMLPILNKCLDYLKTLVIVTRIQLFLGWSLHIYNNVLCKFRYNDPLTMVHSNW